MHAMTEEMNALTQKTKQETVSMRIITLVTLFFLPGTFISVCLFSLTYFVRFHFLSPSPSALANTEQQTIMSTDIVQYSKIPNSNDYEEEYSSAALKRYVMVTLPLMALTFLAWWILYFWVETKQRVEALTAKIKRGGSVSIVWLENVFRGLFPAVLVRRNRKNPWYWWLHQKITKKASRGARFGFIKLGTGKSFPMFGVCCYWFTEGF